MPKSKGGSNLISKMGKANSGGGGGSKSIPRGGKAPLPKINPPQ